MGSLVIRRTCYSCSVTTVFPGSDNIVSWLMKNKFLRAYITCLLLLCTACSDKLSPTSSDTTKTEFVLLFTSLDRGDIPDNNHNPRIVSITKDSSSYRNLIGGFLTAPPAATKVAFRRGSSVVLLNCTTLAETISFTASTPRTSVHNVALSPNGQKITFTLYDSTVANTSTARTTYITNVNGTASITVPVSADISPVASFPRFSSDGSQLALFQTIPQNTRMTRRLLIIDTDGGNPPREIASINYYWKQPPGPAACDWSPDGSRLAYSLGDTIRIADRNGKDVTPFLSPITGLFPAWSPDGTLLVFSAVETALSGNDLFSIQALGPHSPSKLTDIARSGSAAVHPQWSPNGKYILYTIYNGEMFKSDGMLSVLTIATRTTKHLAPNAFAGFWMTVP